MYTVHTSGVQPWWLPPGGRPCRTETTVSNGPGKRLVVYRLAIIAAVACAGFLSGWSRSI